MGSMVYSYGIFLMMGIMQDMYVCISIYMYICICIIYIYIHVINRTSVKKEVRSLSPAAIPESQDLRSPPTFFSTQILISRLLLSSHRFSAG